MARQQTITTLPRSPSDDRHSRMIKYSITMGIRMVCIVACLFVRDWWLLIPAAGAIVLPYIAVVIANVGSRTGRAVESPGGLVHVPAEAPRAALPGQTDAEGQTPPDGEA